MWVEIDRKIIWTRSSSGKKLHSTHVQLTHSRAWQIVFQEKRPKKENITEKVIIILMIVINNNIEV